MIDVRLGDFAKRHEPKDTAARQVDLPYTYPAPKLSDSAADLLETRTPIEDQRSLGSCTCQAATTAIEHNACGAVDLSQLCLYWLGRRAEGDGSECRDEGARIPLVAKMLLLHGVCDKAAWPYEESKVNDIPSEAALQASWSNKRYVKAFYRIQDRPSGIRGALLDDRKIVAAFALNAKDWQGYTGGVLPLPRSTQAGHAVCIVGRVPDTSTSDGLERAIAMLSRLVPAGMAEPDLAEISGAYVIQNSWGEGWGYGGFAFVSAEYVHDRSMCYDLTVFT